MEETYSRPTSSPSLSDLARRGDSYIMTFLQPTMKQNLKWKRIVIASVSVCG